jgi:hypothetical protein
VEEVERRRCIGASIQRARFWIAPVEGRRFRRETVAFDLDLITVATSGPQGDPVSAIVDAFELQALGLAVVLNLSDL